ADEPVHPYIGCRNGRSCDRPRSVRPLPEVRLPAPCDPRGHDGLGAGHRRNRGVSERRRAMASYRDREPSAWAIGWTWFAGFLMIMIGVWHAIAGLSAIIDDEFYVTTRNYILKFDTTTWGWMHLILGILVLLAGFGVFSGAVWALTARGILGVVASVT